MRPGSRIHVAMTKWGERPHWEFDGRLLGEDEHGTWLGIPAGTPHARPGMAFDSEVDSVTLFPREGWWVATFQAPGIWCDTYVDITTPATIEGDRAGAIDLDLDVVRLSADGRVYVDDEDEFAEHRVTYAYPADVVRSAEEACAGVRAAMERREAPYDDTTAARWLGRLAVLARR
ncbi:DUF402 domain-containing protein [Nocardioides rotundus]|uniref:DUF402 domain-containing protein n=1 Tax=Nocardioides rotundus TaxID=1774216 RepID=UPI001CC0622C|nr:DUF402 domain-containing protein [Nocardioides rotundus]UAL30541.1 DUF402 domain-containing protein [Nocardioides rotundus]